MAEENRFFRAVSRINSVIFLFALILLCGFVIVQIISETSGRKVFTRGFDNTSLDDKPITMNLGFGKIEQIYGTNYQYITLDSEGKMAKFSGSGYSSGDFRNILFLSKEMKEARRLFPTHQYIISSFEQLGQNNCCQGDNGKSNPTKALFYMVIKRDTNGDGKLTDDDIPVVAFSKPDGTGYAEVITDADRIIEHTSVNQGAEVAVLLEKDNKVLYRTYSTESFAMTSESFVINMKKKNIPSK